MNNQINRRQVGRITGRIAEDAGIMNYREKLARANNSSASSRSSSVSYRMAAGVVVAMLLLVLAVSAGAVAQTAGIGCLYLTPGTCGCGRVFAGIERAPGIGLSIMAEISGSLELSVAGRNSLQRVARYNGELCHGPYVFAP